MVEGVCAKLRKPTSVSVRKPTNTKREHTNQKVPKTLFKLLISRRKPTKPTKSFSHRFTAKGEVFWNSEKR